MRKKAPLTSRAGHAPAAPPNPKVCILITNRNGRRHLENLLPNVFETDYEDFRLYLLDDSSVDDSVEFTQKHFPSVVILESQTNLGYVRNCNRGFVQAIRQDADYTALLTNDILLDPRWLKASVAALETDARAAVVGFDVLGMPYPSDYDTFVREMQRRQTVTVEEVKGKLIGCALVIRTSVLKNIGLFDPGYVMYGEEDDFEARVQRAGCKVLKLSVPLYHKTEGTDWGNQKLKPSVYATRNAIQYALKNEKLLRVFLWTLYVFHMGCNPFIRIDKTNAPARRLRPRNIFVNAFIDAYALLWNLYHLPATLKRRRQDNARADKLAKEWATR